MVDDYKNMGDHLMRKRSITRRPLREAENHDSKQVRLKMKLIRRIPTQTPEKHVSTKHVSTPLSTNTEESTNPSNEASVIVPTTKFRGVRRRVPKSKIIQMTTTPFIEPIINHMREADVVAERNPNTVSKQATIRKMMRSRVKFINQDSPSLSAAENKELLTTTSGTAAHSKIEMTPNGSRKITLATPTSSGGDADISINNDDDDVRTTMFPEPETPTTTEKLKDTKAVKRSPYLYDDTFAMSFPDFDSFGGKNTQSSHFSCSLNFPYLRSVCIFLGPYQTLDSLETLCPVLNNLNLNSFFWIL